MTLFVLLAVGLGSYALRVGPLLLLERNRPAPALEHAIRHGGLAAIAALVALSTADVAAAGGAVPALLATGAGAALAARRVPMLPLLAGAGGVYALARLASEMVVG